MSRPGMARPYVAVRAQRTSPTTTQPAAPWSVARLATTLAAPTAPDGADRAWHRGSVLARVRPTGARLLQQRVAVVSCRRTARAVTTSPSPAWGQKSRRPSLLQPVPARWPLSGVDHPTARHRASRHGGAHGGHRLGHRYPVVDPGSRGGPSRPKAGRSPPLQRGSRCHARRQSGGPLGEAAVVCTAGTSAGGRAPQEFSVRLGAGASRPRLPVLAAVVACRRHTQRVTR